MKKSHLIPLFVLLTVIPASAGTITPALEAKLDKLGDKDLIKVLVVMQDQPDIATLDKSLRSERATLPERHMEVVTTLQDAARASQGDLLASLEGNKSLGGIAGYTPHWIINAVVVKGTAAAIRDIAARPDVKQVEPDIKVELIEPPMIKEIPHPRDKSASGFVTSGIKAIGADRVWHELGIDGSGTLVANMDSGVDGTHPALSGRWRGNTVPASHAWFDAGGIGSATPWDVVGHGTHVMGTIMGATAFDTVGVAPAAEWIATNPLVGSGRTDIAIIAAFEWLADPDGNPATMADVPDVCQNSWGIVPDGFPEPCDITLWDVIDNCEAAGVVVTFSAGNEGPGLETLRFPGNRASTPTNCFTIGSTSFNPPYEVSTFSSRGPSQCGGPYEIKPEVTAPGESIYSAYPGGSYVYMDGTSMAGPHVAGVVALMRQAAPDLDVTTIKEILMSTAVDLGTPGEDNHYGHGMVDAYAAVFAVMGNVGTVTGTVTDSGSGSPLAGVEIRDTRGWTRTETDALGVYGFNLLSGPTVLAVDAFGYLDSELNITVPTDAAVLDLDIPMTAMPPAVVSGFVTGPGGTPVDGATVSALGTPVTPVFSDAAGYYSITLPSGPDTAYDLMAIAPDLAYSLEHTGLQGSRTIDFSLPVLQTDGFESGGFSSFDWLPTGDLPWTVVGDQAHEGVKSARSGAIGDAESSELSIDFFVQGDGDLEFHYKVDSEHLFDTLKFYIDGALAETWSGSIDWTPYIVTVPSGQHSFRWVYTKDESASSGLDAAWIDLVKFPGTGIRPEAGITLSQTTLVHSMDAGTTASLPVTLGNTGNYRLDYETTASASTKTAVPWLSVSPAAGSVHPGSVAQVMVEFDSNLLWSGTHNADLRFLSNDPAHPDTLVAVELTVTPVSSVGDGLPRHLVFRGAVPNPFNPATDIKFSLPRSAQVNLDVYDVSGRLVRTLLAGRLAAGNHSERWDGRDNSGLNTASGIYFARLRFEGETSIKSMALVR